MKRAGLATLIVGAVLLAACGADDQTAATAAGDPAAAARLHIH